MRPGARTAACASALLAAVALCGCTHTKERPLALIEDGALAPPEPAHPRGVRELSQQRRPRRTPGDAIPAQSRVPSPDASRATLKDLPSAATSPDGFGFVRSSAPPAHQKLDAGTSLEQRAREAFLSCETTVDADKATLFVPPSYAPEAILTGVSVVEDGPGRRTATGSGMLRLRRLTIRAAKLTVVARTDGAPDVSVSARGNVTFRADRPASVIDERDLKSLLIRNDTFVPLR